MKLAFAVCTFLLALSAVAQTDAPSKWNKVLQEVDSVNEGASCPDFSKATFSSYSCHELLDDKIPAWVNQNDPQKFFSTYHAWQPLCGYSNLMDLRQASPKASEATLVARLIETEKAYDTCAVKTENRYSSVYKAPTRNDLKKNGFRLLTRAERTDRMNLIEDILARSTLACCGVDDDCMKLMHEVSVKFCKAEPNPNKPDPCIDDQTAYTSFAKDEWLNQEDSAYSGKFVPIPGSMEISPYNNEESDVYAHEFGHACSNIRDQLLMVRGDLAAVDLFKKRKGCAVDPKMKSFYGDFMKRAGYTEETRNCVFDETADAPRDRFDSGQCEKGCSLSHLEEQLADLLSFTVMKDDEFKRGVINNGACVGQRDSEHHLTADLFTCSLKTPSFQDQVERISRCRK